MNEYSIVTTDYVNLSVMSNQDRPSDKNWFIFLSLDLNLQSSYTTLTLDRQRCKAEMCVVVPTP